jgi:hypothetical protein
VRLSSRKAACSSVAPQSSTGNPGLVYTNCETAPNAQANVQRRILERQVVKLIALIDWVIE